MAEPWMTSAKQRLQKKGKFQRVKGARDRSKFHAQIRRIQTRAGFNSTKALQIHPDMPNRVIGIRGAISSRRQDNPSDEKENIAPENIRRNKKHTVPSTIEVPLGFRRHRGVDTGLPSFEDQSQQVGPRLYQFAKATHEHIPRHSNDPRVGRMHPVQHFPSGGVEKLLHSVDRESENYESGPPRYSYSTTNEPQKYHDVTIRLDTAFSESRNLPGSIPMHCNRVPLLSRETDPKPSYEYHMKEAQNQCRWDSVGIGETIYRPTSSPQARFNMIHPFSATNQPARHQYPGNLSFPTVPTPVFYETQSQPRRILGGLAQNEPIHSRTQNQNPFVQRKRILPPVFPIPKFQKKLLEIRNPNINLKSFTPNRQSNDPEHIEPTLYRPIPMFQQEPYRQPVVEIQDERTYHRLICKDQPFVSEFEPFDEKRYPVAGLKEGEFAPMQHPDFEESYCQKNEKYFPISNDARYPTLTPLQINNDGGNGMNQGTPVAEIDTSKQIRKSPIEVVHQSKFETSPNSSISDQSLDLENQTHLWM